MTRLGTTPLLHRAAISLVFAIALFAAPVHGQDTAHVVVLATTDVHGRVFHWDYVHDREAPWGLTRAATVVDSLRELYPDRVVLVDAGDLIQGNPFAAFFATVRPVAPHPVIDAMNALRYDTGTPGNHEFNWGLDVLARAVASAAFPIVSGNVYKLPRDVLAYPPYALLQRGDVRIAVTGFTTPGSIVWDRANLTGKVAVKRIVPQASRVFDELSTARVDLRIAVIHSGLSGRSSYDTTGVGAENVAAALARLPGKPDLVVVGHSHWTIGDSVIGGVHFMQPAPWARALAVAHVWLTRERGKGKGERGTSIRRSADPPGGAGYRVVQITAEQIPLADVVPDPAVTRRLTGAHEAVRAWVSAPLARVEGDWGARYARAEDTPIIDFVNEVQRTASGAQLSSTSAFNVAAGFGAGEVRLRDVAGIYPYENTLTAVRIDGARLKAYLEQASSYFRTYRPGEPVINDQIPGYNFDIVSGVEYVIDLTRPVGERIRQLTYENIRDLITDYLRRSESVDAADYFQPSWRIVPREAEAAVRAAFAPRTRQQP